MESVQVRDLCRIYCLYVALYENRSLLFDEPPMANSGFHPCTVNYITGSSCRGVLLRSPQGTGKRIPYRLPNDFIDMIINLLA